MPTPIQTKLLRFITKYQKKNHGTSPSQRDMMKHMDYQSTSSITYLLGQLEERECIRFIYNESGIRKHREIIVLK